MTPITPQRRKELRALYANTDIAGGETIIGLLDLVDELERDAERYRWLREFDNFPGDEGKGQSLWDRLGELECNEFDAFIDAEMAKE